MNKSGFFTLPALAFLSLTLCTDIRLAGPSTEQGNPQIVAIVIDDKNRPIENAMVIINRVSPMVDSSQQPASATRVGVRQTDISGKCSFYDMFPGLYSLEASDISNKYSALATNIMISAIKPDHPAFSDTIVLAAPGSITGVVSRGNVLGNSSNQNLNDAFIQVKIGEVDRVTVTGSDGKYLFKNLPVGSYTLYYYATDGFYSSKRTNITVYSNLDKKLETVILRPVPRLLPPKGFTAKYDTTAGIVRLNWQKVTFDSLRWYEVERINLTVFNSTVHVVTDTLYSDTVGTISKGTILDYVVRSVDKAFMRSANAGPMEIKVAK